MLSANPIHKPQIIDLLYLSRDSFGLVQILKFGDRGVDKRLKSFIRYSFEICSRYGRVHYSECDKICALVLLTKRQKSSFYRTWLKFRMIVQIVQIKNLVHLIKRCMMIEAAHENVPMYYILFSGANSNHNESAEIELMKRLIRESDSLDLPIYLETTSPQIRNNYRKLGFVVYYEMMFDDVIYFMKRPVSDLVALATQ